MSVRDASTKLNWFLFLFLFCCCSSDYFGLFILQFFIFYSLYLCTLTITYLRRCLDNDIFLRFVEILSADYTGVLKCLFIYTILVLLSIFDEVTKKILVMFILLLLSFIYNKNVVVNFLSTVHHPHETIITNKCLKCKAHLLFVVFKTILPSNIQIIISTSGLIIIDPRTMRFFITQQIFFLFCTKLISCPKKNTIYWTNLNSESKIIIIWQS